MHLSHITAQAGVFPEVFNNVLAFLHTSGDGFAVVSHLLNHRFRFRVGRIKEVCHVTVVGFRFFPGLCPRETTPLGATAVEEVFGGKNGQESETHLVIGAATTESCCLLICGFEYTCCLQLVARENF